MYSILSRFELNPTRFGCSSSGTYPDKKTFSPGAPTPTKTKLFDRLTQ